MGKGIAGWGIGLLAVAALGAGCRQSNPLTPAQQAGEHLYKVRCAHCHEENDLVLKPPPPPLSGLFDRTFLPSGARATDEQVGRTILNGKGKMPPFQGRFDQEQLDDLVAFLHTGLR